MIDPALLRDNPDVIRQSQVARGHSADTVDEAIEADKSRRAAISRFEELRAEQNAFGKKVAAAPKDEKAELVAQAKGLAEGVKAAQADATAAEEVADKAMRRIENIVIDGVPDGGEKYFVVLRHVG